MRTFSRFSRMAVGAVATALAATLALSGCGGAGEESQADSTAPTTLKLHLFGDASAIKTQLVEYKKLHPNITVDLQVTASAEDARTNMLTKLAANKGLADVEAVEISWTNEMKKYAKKFVPVPKDEKPWVKVQAEPVTLEDGSLFGYGGGTGPQAICYRESLLKKAGLPTDEASIKKMFGGSWQDYFETGKQFAAKSGGTAWYDSAYMVYNAQVEQNEHPYEDADNKVVVGTDDTVKKIFDETMATATTQSAHLEPFSTDWNNAMGTGKFATMTCPSWLLSTIEGNSKNITDWRVADAFPGGGGNVGGTYLTVPTQSKHQKAAQELASWLTSSAQQIDAFKKGSAFPSRQEALDSPELQKVTNKFFDNAPVGKIYADRSKAIKVVMYKGQHYTAIDTAAYQAVTRVETNRQSAGDAWKQFVTEAEK